MSMTQVPMSSSQRERVEKELKDAEDMLGKHNDRPQQQQQAEEDNNATACGATAPSLMPPLPPNLRDLDAKIAETQEAAACIDATISALLVCARCMLLRTSTSKPHFCVKQSMALCELLTPHPFQDANSGLHAAGPDLPRSLQRTRAALQIELCGMTLGRILAHQPPALLRVLQSSQPPSPLPLLPLKRAAGCRVQNHRNAAATQHDSRFLCHPVFNLRCSRSGAIFRSACCCLYSCRLYSCRLYSCYLYSCCLYSCCLYSCRLYSCCLYSCCLYSCCLYSCCLYSCGGFSPFTRSAVLPPFPLYTITCWGACFCRC
jgi:hypothetical protein